MQVPEASGSMLRQYKSSVDNAKDPIVNSVSFPTPLTNTHSMELSEDCRTSMNRNRTLITASTEESRDPTANTLWHGKDVRDGAVTTQLEDMVIAILSIFVAFISPIVLL